MVRYKMSKDVRYVYQNTGLSYLNNRKITYKKEGVKKLKGFLTLQAIFMYTSHMIFIVPMKKILTSHLLLTNPTAVFPSYG